MSGDRILSELDQNQVIGQMIDTWCKCNEKGYLTAKNRQIEALIRCERATIEKKNV